MVHGHLHPAIGFPPAGCARLLRATLLIAWGALAAGCPSGNDQSARFHHGEGVPAGAAAFTGWAVAVDQFTPGIERWAEDDGERALGAATGNELDVTVLGRGGAITLRFDPPIIDGPGADFAVFENGFVSVGGPFLELATVAVSGDGGAFHAFAVETDNRTPVAEFAPIDPSAYRGFAGLHLAGTGTAFDLARLPSAPGPVVYVRITDVVGDGSATDRFGNPIYDPYPTTGSAGFDLEAIGVLAQ